MHPSRTSPVSSIVVILLVAATLVLSGTRVFADTDFALKPTTQSAIPDKITQPVQVEYPEQTIGAAQLNAATDTVLLKPVADAFISSGARTENFEGQTRLVVSAIRGQTASDARTLVRFDLPTLPPGTIINKASLTLFQSSGSGADWTESIARITTDWDVNKVAWINQPQTVCCAANSVSKATDPQTVWDMTALVRQWVYDAANTPNFGVMILGQSANISTSIVRIYGAAEGDRAPQLLVDYTLPPTNVGVPLDRAVITLNGSCDTDNEYQNAASYLFLDRDNRPGIVYLKHNNANLYLCVNAPAGVDERRFFSVYLDKDNGQEKVAEADDFALQIAINGGAVRSLAGTGVANGYQPIRLDGWNATVVSAGTGGSNFDSVEYQIPLTLAQDRCGAPFGLALYHHQVAGTGTDYGWPSNQFFDQPQSWTEIRLANPNCPAAQPPTCPDALTDPAQIPPPAFINFDDVKDATVLENVYRASHGVIFENGRVTRAISYGDRTSDPTKARSTPNVALNSALAPNTSADVPMRITFVELKTHVGFYMGNGENADLTGTLIAYDANGQPICQVQHNPVPEAYDHFTGIHDAEGRIAAVSLDYGNTVLSEVIDDLYFAPPPSARVQVCRETTENCRPAGGAIVHPIVNGQAQATLVAGADGYVDASGLVAGDELWAMWDVTAQLASQIPVSMTERYSMYYTSADVVALQPNLFGPDNVLHLAVTAQKPLMLYNAEMSSEWVLDDGFKPILTTNVISGSNFLYDFTDGQFSLGNVTVYQDLEQWPGYYNPVGKADIRLYANDNLQPKAFAGGVVTVPISDTVNPAEVLYRPGFIMMGTDWNRFKKPPDDPSLPRLAEEYGFTLDDLKIDWSLAFAHEHGHYLLFLFDTYLKLTEDGETEQVDDCTHSAMGWFYELQNRFFVHSTDDWLAHCQDTYAHQLLKRKEWQVIKDHYPWVQEPMTYTVGPTAPPIPLTTVTFKPPADATGLVGDTIFDLDYETDPGASPQGRGFVIQNGRVIDQGTPAEGARELLVRGAREGDRFCYTDINQNADPADQRFRYGCETVAASDTSLFLEQDLTWVPLIDPRPTGATTWGITVTQVPSTLPLQAILYPENETTPFTITLAPGGTMTSTGEFTLPGVTPAAHIEVRVDETDTETNPARTAWVDFGIGGGTVPGSHWGEHAPAYSSDGLVEVYPRTSIALGPDEFVTVVRLLNTYRLPSTAISAGTPYAVVAYPSSLVDDAIINIHIPTRRTQIRGANTSMQQTQIVIHYWNGRAWEPVPTTVTQEPAGSRLASASTAGRRAGIYMAIEVPLEDSTGTQTFLPLIMR